MSDFSEGINQRGLNELNLIDRSFQYYCVELSCSTLKLT